MKKNNPLFILLATFFISCSLSAQSQEEMKAYTEYMTPGPIQQMMAKSEGVWSSSVTFWASEGAQPTSSSMETTNEMILGGRYLRSDNKGVMMGAPFEGIGVTGYDNAKKIFVNSWIDNLGTGIIFLEGTLDAATNTIHYSGKSTDAVTKKDVPIRETLQFTDDTHQLLTIYYTVKGKEFKAMEIKSIKK